MDRAAIRLSSDARYSALLGTSDTRYRTFKRRFCKNDLFLALFWPFFRAKSAGENFPAAVCRVRSVDEWLPTAVSFMIFEGEFTSTKIIDGGPFFRRDLTTRALEGSVPALVLFGCGVVVFEPVLLAKGASETRFLRSL